MVATFLAMETSDVGEVAMDGDETEARKDETSPPNEPSSSQRPLAPLLQHRVLTVSWILA
jgi:hypothetical protein